MGSGDSRADIEQDVKGRNAREGVAHGKEEVHVGTDRVTGLV